LGHVRSASSQKKCAYWITYKGLMSRTLIQEAHIHLSNVGGLCNKWSLGLLIATQSPSQPKQPPAGTPDQPNPPCACVLAHARPHLTSTPTKCPIPPPTHSPPVPTGWQPLPLRDVGEASCLREGATNGTATSPHWSSRRRARQPRSRRRV
jgi:hypothetical protein